jgi:hypothetical protein
LSTTAKSAVVVGAAEVDELDGGFCYWLRRTPTKLELARAQCGGRRGRGGSEEGGEETGVLEKGRGGLYF